MPITRDELDPTSAVAGMVNPQMVRLPRADPGGVTDMVPVALGDRLVLSGSYCRNISSDTFSCDLRVPTCLVIVAVANADTWSVFVRGRNQFGQAVSEVITKTRTNCQTGRRSNWCYSRIDEARITAASTIGNRLRLGLMYGSWAFNVVEFGSRIVSGADIAKNIPLPFKAASASDVQIRFKGYEPDYGQVITFLPVTANATFTTTDVTSSAAWDVTGVLANDLVYTHDGFVGIVVSTGANAINITTAWWREKDGTNGTPANKSGSANNTPAVLVYRPAAQDIYSGTTFSGLIPGLPVLSSASNVDTGVQRQYSTFGFLDFRQHEPLVDLLFEVYCRVGSKS